MVRFFHSFAGLTVVFEGLLLYSMGGPSLLDPSSSYGLDLSIGVTFALVAFVESELVAVPIQLKAVRRIKDMLAAGKHEPPAEFPKTQLRAVATALVTLVLLLITSVFMVGAGFY